MSVTYNKKGFSQYVHLESYTKVKIRMLFPIQQTGPYRDNLSVLPLVGVTVCDWMPNLLITENLTEK